MIRRLGEATPAQMKEMDQLLDMALGPKPSAGSTAPLSPRPDIDPPDGLPTASQSGAQATASPPLTIPVPAAPVPPVPDGAAAQPDGLQRDLFASSPSDATTLGALLAKADQQIAAGHGLQPPDDNAITTLARALVMLSRVEPADAQEFHAFPAHLRARAEAAELAGNSAQAADYRLIATVIGDISAGPATESGPTARLASKPPVNETQPDTPPVTATSKPPPPQPLAPPPMADTPEISPQPKPPPASAVGRRPQAIAPIVSGPATTRCQSLIQRAQIGEDLADADRAYLRRGCS
ncbi:MAG: hypothetical protein JSS43_19120 [Proteobacteria bacterium]|nr:hypothetical protein [Pseudomonadota bacterium]